MLFVGEATVSCCGGPVHVGICIVYPSLRTTRILAPQYTASLSQPTAFSLSIFGNILLEILRHQIMWHAVVNLQKHIPGFKGNGWCKTRAPNCSLIGLWYWFYHNDNHHNDKHPVHRSLEQGWLCLVTSCHLVHNLSFKSDMV